MKKTKTLSLRIQNKVLFVYENKKARNSIPTDTTTSTITLTGTGIEFNAPKSKIAS